MRRLAACLAVLSVLGLGVLPPEHVHETEAEDGSHSEVVHRHFEPHHQFDVDPEHDSVAGGGLLDHQDGAETRWLDPVFITSDPTQHVHGVVQFVSPLLLVAEPLQSCRWTPSCPENSGHDPPWVLALGLRAPPTLLV